MGALATSERYFAPEFTKVHFLTTIADADLEATRVEITAGTDLSGEVRDMSGWQVKSNDIATPGLSDFTGSIPGRTSVEKSSITFYGDRHGDDVRAVLSRGLTGFIVIMDHGDVPTDPMDVFPVRVGSVGKPRSTGEESYQLVVEFSITRKPAVDVPIPALV